MDNESTTPVDNPTNSDATDGSTTVTDPNTGTDSQPADTGDNLNDSSKSTDTSDDGDKPTNEDGSEALASKFDDDLDQWIEKRGLAKPETEEQLEAYQAVRNEQREYTRSRQLERAASDAKALGDEIHNSRPEDEEGDDEFADPLERRQDKIERQLAEERNTRLQSEFYTENKVSEEEHKVILDIYKEKVSRPTTPEGKKSAFDLWSNPDSLGDLLDLARARISNSVGTSIVEAEAARKERERIAKESNANSPGRGAKTTESGAKTPEAQRLERFSTWD